MTMTWTNYEATIDAKVSEVEDLAKRMGDADYDELLQLADEMKLAISSLEWAVNGAKTTEAADKGGAE
jgi:hypothetical protein